MLAKMIGFFGEKPTKKPHNISKRSIIKRSQVISKKEETQDVVRVSKELFWKKYPHYPAMNSSYRRLFQKLKVDNSKTIKVHDARCGTDLCQIASGVGPHVDYCSPGESTKIIDFNLKKFDLGRKTQKVTEDDEATTQQYIAHLMSFEPALGDDKEIDWNRLADNTLSGGFIMVPRMLTSAEDTAKVAQKLADNIEFYFYTKVDHTAHWISVLEDRFAAIKKMAPQSMTTQSKEVLTSFIDEATKWTTTLKDLKSDNKKIFTMIYKRDDM